MMLQPLAPSREMFVSMKHFYDPHAGFSKTLVPLPEPVRQVARQLDGQTLPLEEAVRRLQEVAEGTIRVSGHCLALEVEISPRVNHIHRVICFRDAGSTNA